MTTQASEVFVVTVFYLVGSVMSQLGYIKKKKKNRSGIRVLLKKKKKKDKIFQNLILNSGVQFTQMTKNPPFLIYF